MINHEELKQLDDAEMEYISAAGWAENFDAFAVGFASVVFAPFIALKKEMKDGPGGAKKYFEDVFAPK